MSYYPKTPEAVAETIDQNLLGAIGELYWWMEALTETYEPVLSDEGVEMILGGVLA